MIKLENTEKLYYIENIGCDDETHGLAIIQDEDFDKFKEIIINLNKNSTYGCMPTIRVYRINPDLVEEVNNISAYTRDEVMFLNGKIYKEEDGAALFIEGDRVI